MSPTAETIEPTLSPTIETGQPTFTPTTEPTGEPTLSPTLNPTQSPTIETLEPTFAPTIVSIHGKYFCSTLDNSLPTHPLSKSLHDHSTSSRHHLAPQSHQQL